MGEHLDVIVIGAGHNGLALSALLARRGKSVLVVERREITGGLCAGEEFHPGYRSPGLHHDTTGLRPGIVDALSLDQHGIEFEDETPPIFSPQRDGPGLLLHEDAGKAAAEIAQFSERDAARYRDYRAFIARARTVVEPILNSVPPDIADLSPMSLLPHARHAIALRRLGSLDMMDMMRIPPMCVADWLREYFETELLNASLATPAILGTWCGPWSPGTAANLLLRECAARRTVRGGAAAVASALELAARHAGVVIRTSARVQRIVVDNGVVTGVVLEGGETLSAPLVVSTCDPKTTFLELLEPAAVGFAFARAVETYRTRGTTAKVHLALNRPLVFAGRPGLRVEFARTGESLDRQERAFDAVKYRGMSEHPLLDILVPSVSRPDWAPSGHASVSILVHFVPLEREGGWNDSERERLGDRVVRELAEYAPEVASSIVARQVLTPADIEARYGVAGGHIHHGEHALDQLVTRPVLYASRFRTPIRGLMICGAGTFPGGGVTAAPALLSSQVI